MTDQPAGHSRLLATGIVGTIVAAVCCFTPIVTVALTAAGLVALTSYLDLVLLPALAVFPAITGYALWRRQRVQ